MLAFRRALSLAILVHALGCGSEPAATTAAATPPTTATPTTPTTETAPATTETPPVTPTPTTAPVDLLHAVPATVIVSSVYNDDATQLSRIADGDLATAWNSRTGDLEGAWIVVDLPADATVSAVELTVGYTREGGRTDLFSGNQRIARVRVLRDGTSVAEQDLDTESRALQSIAIPPGIAGLAWRIEIVRMLPGSRTDWREVCISELRVLGTPGATVLAGATPTFRVGEEAAAASASASEAADAVPGDETEQEIAAAEISEAVEDFGPLWAQQRVSAPLSELAAAETALQARIDAASVRGQVGCDWAGVRLEVRLSRLAARLEQVSTDAVTATGQVEDDLGADGHRVTEREIERRTAEIQARLDGSEEAIEAIDRLGEADTRLGLARRVVAAHQPVVPEVDLTADWTALQAVAAEAVAACH